jgi:6-methylsalicylate decarboxylase
MTNIVSPMTRTDVHQHLWPEPFLAALAARSALPRLRRDSGGGWSVELAGEPPAPVDPAAHDPGLRARLVARDGLDRALLCMSSPLGAEGLPADEARELLDTWHAAVLGLGEPFGVWGAIALRDAAPAEVDAILDRGAIGISMPAGALATPRRLERLGPLLEALERRGAPLLVHPGPGLEDAAATPEDPGTTAPWWPALTAYPAQLGAAWHAWVDRGRARHPSLRVLFAALAGGAPLHAERLVARGGPAGAATDPLVFYDTSSYGPRAIDAVARVTGVDALVHASDRPVAVPSAHGLGPAGAAAVTRSNPARLLHGPVAGATGLAA